MFVAHFQFTSKIVILSRNAAISVLFWLMHPGFPCHPHFSILAHHELWVNASSKVCRIAAETRIIFNETALRCHGHIESIVFKCRSVIADTRTGLFDLIITSKMQHYFFSITTYWRSAKCCFLMSTEQWHAQKSWRDIRQNMTNDCNSVVPEQQQSQLKTICLLAQNISGIFVPLELRVFGD